MTKTASLLNYQWAHCLVEELYRTGITHFCLSPGSRCTPLTTAIANHPQLKTTVHFDERGLGYFAVGIARALGRPAVLVSTSGTAVANFYPAVVESAMACIPLVILTADRPPELREAGANQTIDQVKIFNHYVRWQFDLPCPTPEIRPEVILTTVDQAVHRATRMPAGPVHLNCMFRVPFLPDDMTQLDLSNDSPISLSPLELVESNDTNIAKWKKSGHPYTQYPKRHVSLQKGTLERISTSAKKAVNGFIIVGYLRTDAERQAVLELIQKLNWPVYPDITSGLRFGYPLDPVIHYFDLLLHHPQFSQTFAPRTTIQLGSKITSKRLYKYLKSIELTDYYIVDSNSSRLNPEHIAGHQLEIDISTFCQTLIAYIKDTPVSPQMSTLKKLSKEIDGTLDVQIHSEEALTEPALARLISRHIPEKTGLFIASSMPIRDMDLFSAANGPAVHIAANRGASGIDGTIASAVGFARGLRKVVTLLIGDLALLHDLNSLALIKSEEIQLVVVVINNNGGGIFSFLPISKQTTIFEKYFATPHNFTCQNAAEMFGLSYTKPTSQESFTKAYKDALSTTESTLIEVATNRQQNRDFHEKIIRQVNAKIQDITQKRKP